MTQDDAGTTVAEALADCYQIGFATPGPRRWAAWIEAHIEQGPVLEAEHVDIGIVTGTVQARYFQITLEGEPSHVGPTTMDRRQDSLAAAAEMILAAERIGLAAEPGGRSSAAWIQNLPNVRGAVPNRTLLHMDVRHEDETRAHAMEVELLGDVHAIAARRRVRVTVDPYATFGPVRFDQALGAMMREAAHSRQLSTRDIVASAGHDSVLIAPLCASAMLFIPSRGGITHNPAEYSSAEQIARGAQVLLDVVVKLAS
jgi:N-carbamoyl-L-amino-acid hydrolase